MGRRAASRDNRAHYVVVLLDENTGAGFETLDGFRTEKQAVKAAKSYCAGRGVVYSGSGGLHHIKCSAIVRKYVDDGYTVVFSCAPAGFKPWKDET